jgi:hypothetical protein
MPAAPRQKGSAFAPERVPLGAFLLSIQLAAAT